MIRGYVEQPSPRPGGDVTLRVATDAPAWRVEFHRCRELLVACGGAGWFPGVDAPPHLPGQDWGLPGTGLAGEPLAPWPAYRLRVPGGWASGVYLLWFVEGDGGGRDRAPVGPPRLDAASATALLVVRSPAPGTVPLLYKVPLLTYHAYNLAGGPRWDRAARRGAWCFYDMPGPEEVRAGVRLACSLHRPGGGTGSTPYDVDNWDPYDPTPRQTFAHWDARMVGWLERQGYAVDYCTDIDLHRDGVGLLAPYRLLLSVGHDEYWTDAMRDAVEGWVGGGGNAVLLGGNTCWWRVEFDPDGVVCRRTGFWWEAGRPENALTGVSFRNGGERDRDEHPLGVGFRVQHADHWVWAGTGVRDGDVVGAAEHVVGYECDGALFDRDAWAAGGTAVPAGTDGTPPDFRILGVGDCRPAGFGEGNGAATMGLHTPGGTLFTGATTDWPRALAGGRSPVLERITRTVLDRLGGRRQG